MRVTEPITQLCPERLCPAEPGLRAERLTAMTLDAMVVYLHVVVPRDLRGSLPSLANDWKDFLKAQHWQRRWVSERVADRRQPPMRFIDSDPAVRCSADLVQYLHVLLPHEPFIYMRTGQQFTTEIALPGLTPPGPVDFRGVAGRPGLPAPPAAGGVCRRARRAPLAASDQRGTLRSLAHRDHRRSRRELQARTPLQGRRPDHRRRHCRCAASSRSGQLTGRIDDRNVQAIDFLPTLASRLHVQLRSAVDGTAAVDGASLPTRKVVRHMGAARKMAIESNTLASARMESVARRWSLFEGSVSPVPSGAPRVLLGQPAPAPFSNPVGAPGRSAAPRPAAAAARRPLRVSAPAAPRGPPARPARAPCGVDAGGRRERNDPRRHENARSAGAGHVVRAARAWCPARRIERRRGVPGVG